MQYVNSKVKTRPNITELLHSDGTAASSDTEMATMLNGYFASVFTCKDTTFFPTVDRIGSPLLSDLIKFTPDLFLIKQKSKRFNVELQDYYHQLVTDLMGRDSRYYSCHL